MILSRKLFIVQLILKLQLMKQRVILIFTTFMFSVAAIAQQRTITGSVSDASTGEPLPGVNIVIEGTHQGTVTDLDGEYSIDIEGADATLIYSYIGYLTQRIDAGESTQVNVVLKPEMKSLSEVVVIGYGTQERKDLTGAIATVSANEIKKTTVIDLGKALQGRVPGLVVSQDGWGPGAGTTMRIRGERSFEASNSPLFVVDGIPMDGISDVNINNVESISVLKDASATAIYGSRGANGVIIVDTKKGHKDRSAVTYEATFGYEQISQQADLMNSEQFAEMVRESYRATGVDPSDELIFDPLLLDGMRNNVDTDWMGLISRNGMQHNHQLSIVGGEENTRFMIAPGYSHQEGVSIDQMLERFSLRVNLEHDVSDRLQVGANSFMTRNQYNPGTERAWFLAMRMPPLARPYDDEGFVIFDPANDAIVTSPISQIQNTFYERKNLRMVGILYANLKLFPSLSYRVSFAPDFRNEQSGDYIGPETSERFGGPSVARAGHKERYRYTFDNILQFEKSLGDVHAIDATLLYSMENAVLQGVSAGVQGLPYEHQLFRNLGSGIEVTGVGSEYTQSSLQSFMGRAQYSLFNRYRFTVTGRMDGSSRLSAGNKWAFFPSAAMAWTISDESFMQGLDPVVSYFNLRLSYGSTGNQSISPYQTLGGLNNKVYNFGDLGVVGYFPNKIPNPDLRWERTTSLNLGFDLGFFQDHITANVELYRAMTKDLILERQLPNSTGFSSFLTNIGETRNTGVEVMLSTINVHAGDFHWSSDITFALNRNEIVDLYGTGEDEPGSKWFIGHPIKVFYTLDWSGIWQLGEEDEAAVYGKKPGDIHFIDQDNNGEINADDRVIRGSGYPDWTGGISNNFSYKNFDFSFFVTAEQGGLINNDYMQRVMENLIGRFNIPVVDYWTPQNPSNTIPRPSIEQRAHKDVLAIQDGSYVRIHNVTLGYRLPSSLVQRIRSQRARIFLTVQNPYVFTSKDFIGHDPDGAYEEYDSPAYRTILGGINISF